MSNKKIRICLMLIISVSLLALPKDTKAVTLKEYENQVAKYTAELKEKEAKIARNDAEVAEVKKKISEIENQIKTTENEISTLEKEIEESNQKIAKKKEDSKKIMKYFQVVNGENTYLEYIFGATSITDMIYRMSVVEQLTEYNQKIVKELTKLIEENNKKKSELQEKQKELDKLKNDLQDQKERIEADSASIRETMPSTKDQIKMYQNQVTYWKNKGCKSSDVLGITCGVPKKVSGGASGITAANGFRFPVAGGSITNGYGGHSGHLGIDVTRGSRANSYGAPIYAVAIGEVIAKYYDNAGAKVIKIVHNYNGRLVFSTYAHLKDFNVNEGDLVTPDTIIGYMGNTGYCIPAPSAACPYCGTHLHLEMSEDYDWKYNLSGYNVYNKYINYIVNPFKYIPNY